MIYMVWTSKNYVIVVKFWMFKAFVKLMLGNRKNVPEDGLGNVSYLLNHPNMRISSIKKSRIQGDKESLEQCG